MSHIFLAHEIGSARCDYPCSKPASCADKTSCAELLPRLCGTELSSAGSLQTLAASGGEVGDGGPRTALAQALVPAAGVRWTVSICRTVLTVLHPLPVPTRARAEPHGLLMLAFQASFVTCLTYLGISNLEEILMLVV